MQAAGDADRSGETAAALDGAGPGRYCEPGQPPHHSGATMTERRDGLLKRFSRHTLGAIVAWAGDRLWRRVAALTVIALILLVPGLGAFGPSDRDESRYVQASKQMLETGDFVDIRYLDSPRHKKPAGIYWMQSAAAAAVAVASGGTPAADAPLWAYRIPSLLGGLLAALLTVWATRPLVGARAAFLAGAMTAALLLLSFEARTAKTDAMLLAAVIAAQGALARLWLGVRDDARERAWNVFYFWTALAVGVMLKGPIILIPVIGVLLWLCVRDRSVAGLGRLGARWGVVWLILLAAPWYVAIGVKTEGAFFLDSLIKDGLAKVQSGKESHGAPPGYYLLTSMATFWPWTALLAIAAPFAWRWRSAPETAFLIGWILPMWLLLELIPTKLPHYVLPTFPALCALCAAAVLDGGAQARGGVFWFGAAVWAIIAVALPLGLGLGPLIITGDMAWEAAALSAVALASLSLAWRWLVAGVWIGFVRSAIVGAGALYIAAYQFTLPALEPAWVGHRMATLAAPLRACVTDDPARLRVRDSGAPLGAVGYHEPSFTFLTGGDVALLSEDAAAAWLAEVDGALVWVEDRKEARFQSRLAEAGAESEALAETEGFNYSRGKVVALTLYARLGDPVWATCPAAGGVAPIDPPEDAAEAAGDDGSARDAAADGETSDASVDGAASAAGEASDAIAEPATEAESGGASGRESASDALRPEDRARRDRIRERVEAARQAEAAAADEPPATPIDDPVADEGGADEIGGEGAVTDDAAKDDAISETVDPSEGVEPSDDGEEAGEAPSLVDGQADDGQVTSDPADAAPAADDASPNETPPPNRRETLNRDGTLESDGTLGREGTLGRAGALGREGALGGDEAQGGARVPDGAATPDANDPAASEAEGDAVLDADQGAIRDAAGSDIRDVDAATETPE